MVPVDGRHRAGLVRARGESVAAVLSSPAEPRLACKRRPQDGVTPSLHLGRGGECPPGDGDERPALSPHDPAVLPDGTGL